MLAIGPTAKKKMRLKERRRHFFIDKPLQFRYMLPISLALIFVTAAALINLYAGIWAGVLDAFSDSRFQSDLLTALRLQEYEEARILAEPTEEPFSTLSFFRQAERLSERQREIFRELIQKTNGRLVGKLAFLFILIAVGTVFLSHKIAGPLFRFQKILEALGKGDLSQRCQLRKFDEAKPVAHSMNQAFEALEASILRLKRILGENEKNPGRLVPLLKDELSKFKTGSAD